MSLRKALEARIRDPKKVQKLLNQYWETVAANPGVSFRMECFLA